MQILVFETKLRMRLDLLFSMWSVLVDCWPEGCDDKNPPSSLCTLVVDSTGCFKTCHNKRPTRPSPFDGENPIKNIKLF